MWRPYVPVAARRARALREMNRLRKKGKDIQPVEIEGRSIARSVWGRRWCDHLESYSDYANRLPRGRAYVRNGSVCHLEVHSGSIDAIVSGSELYTVSVRIKKLKAAAWKSIKARCSGQIASMLELLQGKLSRQVMSVVSDRERGLFPKPREIDFTCTCPDWAAMCKHVAAVLYGVGGRLDRHPEALFLLRGVDAEELIAAEPALPSSSAAVDDTLADDALAGIFGIDIDTEALSDAATAPAPPESPPRTRKGVGRRAKAPARTRKGVRPRAASAPEDGRNRPGRPRVHPPPGRPRDGAPARPARMPPAAERPLRRGRTPSGLGRPPPAAESPLPAPRPAPLHGRPRELPLPGPPRGAPAKQPRTPAGEGKPLPPPRPANAVPPRAPVGRPPTSGPPASRWPGCAGAVASPWPSSQAGSACRRSRYTAGKQRPVDSTCKRVH